MRRLLFLVAAIFGATLGDVTVRAATPEDTGLCSTCEAVLDLALANPRRDADRARDVYRHPAETIGFFRIAPGMTVVDYMPSGGWFTRILVPYLGETGHYVGLSVSRPDAPPSDFATAFPAKAAGWTGVPAAAIAAYTPATLPPSLSGAVDRVMIMREVHNLAQWGVLGRELDTIHGLLKPDGMLGIEEHRAKADAPDAYADGSNGYMRQADVIRDIESHGFVLVAKSEINANPKDTADWPKGVWTLPPSYSQGDADRAKYQAIGESDRMTLLFRKR